MNISEMEVSLVDHMGSDLSVVNAARVSFAKTSYFDSDSVDFDGELINPRLAEKDQKLIHYLATHNHWSPFAHCFLSFRIKVPMFVAMQLDKHTVGLVTNSVSRRYVDDEPEFWFPKEWRGRSSNAKQGSEGVVTFMKMYPFNLNISDFLMAETRRVLLNYTQLLEAGVAPEQARMVLPMNTMMERIWSGSLYAFARVYKLRSDPHAQKEIQEVAEMLNNLIEPLFPVSWKELTNE